MEFQDVLKYGYYFDRCIDLDFYDTDMDFICRLKTPERGMKPTITIKGLLIEGGYAIDSYISVQNMAFDIDVAYVGFIKARMYYRGLGEATEENDMTTKMKTGHVIMYKVLYADQEKEPPNRCVRFQCVVAAKDYTLVNTKMYVSGSSLNYLETGKDANTLIAELKNKSGSKASLKTVCEELIKIYNKGITENKKDSENNSRLKELKDNIKITYLEIDENLENYKVQLSPGANTLKKFIRDLNSNITESYKDKFSYAPFKIVIDRGTMRVSKPLPDNWKDMALSDGTTDYDKYYKDNYEDTKVNVYSVDGSNFKKEKTPEVVFLNYVKSATRSECLIYVETLFDDRITPGCKCAIRSNAIMGKKFGSTKSKTRGGSRILNYAGNEAPIIFRNTGKIEYLFSTTEDSYMKMQGPVDGSIDYSTYKNRQIESYGG